MSKNHLKREQEQTVHRTKQLTSNEKDKQTIRTTDRQTDRQIKKTGSQICKVCFLKQFQLLSEKTTLHIRRVKVEDGTKTKEIFFFYICDFF